MENKIIICQQCQQNFVWTADEQEFYQGKGLKEPKFCPVCRATLKVAREDRFRGKIAK